MVEKEQNQKLRARPPIHKRTYVIIPRVQFKVVTLLGGIALVAAFIICVVAYERLMKLSVLFNNSMVPPIMLPQAFQAVADSLMFRLIFIVGIMVLIFVATGIYLTHQLAGPIWKTQIYLKKFINGDNVGPMAFRKGDAFQELPELINEITGHSKKTK